MNALVSANPMTTFWWFSMAGADPGMFIQKGGGLGGGFHHIAFLCGIFFYAFRLYNYNALSTYD